MIGYKAILYDLVDRGLISELIAFWMLFRYLCENDLYFLGTVALGYKELKPERVDEIFHNWFCKEISKDRNTLFLLPRDHTKSTWGIAIKVTQDVLQDANRSILLASITSDMSRKRLRVIKDHLVSKVITTLYPDIMCENPELESRTSKPGPYKSVVWREDEIIVRRDVQRMEFTIQAIGVEQSKPGPHHERMYIDDIIDEITVLSEVQSEVALTFFRGLIPRIEPKGGIIRMFGTRYRAADLYAWVLDKINADLSDPMRINWHVVYREVMEDHETFCKSVRISKEEFEKRKAFDLRDGRWKAFIYDYYDMDLLEEKRAAMENDMFFIAQYYNKIIESDEQVFRPPFKETSTVPPGLKYYMTVDPSFVPTRGSDFTAIVVCGYDAKSTIYIVEAKRLTADVELLLETMYSFYKQYNCSVIGMELGSWQVVMKFALEYARKQKGYDALPIKGIGLSNQKDAKDRRIRAMAYFFNQGSVILKEGLIDLKKELSRYPGNTRSKNDLADALAMQRELILWTKKEEKKAEQFVRPKETYAQLFNLNRTRKKLYINY